MEESGTNKSYIMLWTFIHSDISIISKEFSSTLKQDIITLVKQDAIVIWFSGGSSYDPLYEDMKNIFIAFPLEVCKRLVFVFLDERIVRLDESESNYKTVYDGFFESLIKSGKYIHSQILHIDPFINDIAENYSDKVPHIDIALFGVGEDGHIASLFPHHQLLLSKKSSYIEINDSPKPPLRRITISPKMIEDTTSAYIVFIWQRKNQAYMNFIDPKIDIFFCPAKLILNAKKSNIFKY
jgi:6-phosphogluconolactonase